MLNGKKKHRTCNSLPVSMSCPITSVSQGALWQEGSHGPAPLSTSVGSPRRAEHRAVRMVRVGQHSWGERVGGRSILSRGGVSCSCPTLPEEDGNIGCQF